MQMTRAAFAQWIKRLALAEVTGENGARRAVLDCADEYVRDWCEHRLGRRIHEVLAGVLGVPEQGLEVCYEVRAGT